MSDHLAVRVMVESAWDQVTLDLPATTTMAELKRRALAMTHAGGEAGEYQVKYRGALVTDEARSLAEQGVVGNANLIVLPRRRRPAR
ncbi:MAG: hypothetical protein ACHQ2E_11410 [Gemmatimonadales bacterium]